MVSTEDNVTGDKRDPAVRRQIAERFNTTIPFNQALNIELIDVSAEPIIARIAYRPEFLGDAKAGLWHTSLATTLADSASGLVIFLALPGFENIATLNLHMSYYRPAIAGQALYVAAECHHVTRCVAYARTTLYQDSCERPTAQSTAAFMRTGKMAL